MKYLKDIKAAIAYSYLYLANTGKVIQAKTWQGQDNPQNMFEALDLAFKCPMPLTKGDALALIEPSSPWAEEHLQERVSGIPYNPPPSHKHWPFNKEDNRAFGGNEKFDHTYPERFWPKFAGEDKFGEPMFPEDRIKLSQELFKPNRGIRFEYGDLTDVVNLLDRDIDTRQAFLPIFFPEDTGALGGKKRVPCTLGYHFIVRHGYLHISYFMRSCDALRHFRDDLYMAVRLAQYVVNTLNQEYSDKGRDIKLGMLKFVATSYHVFEWEQKLLNKKTI